ncbi:MAG: hypothetical protein DMG96_22225 [Acidobacteria bacterium]|nr:MAG: hypothetical protein DMG98_22705 [Acidobacteriota bacterium]PYV73727.1 MAG: hypothetical protein DMG96_22225 [Acidobacteriota bacterium]
MKGKLSTKTRHFEQVCGDLKQTVFSVVRHRAEGQETRALPLGSGFFVSSKVFLTCYHVINGKSNLHQDGDAYHLVNNLSDYKGGKGVIHAIVNTTLGKEIHLFKDADLALFTFSTPIADQAYVNLDYGSVQQGADIGVAGYPLPNLVVVNQQLRYDGLLYRVARGTVTATYDAPLDAPEIQSTAVVPMLEVNFLFVPGNSGGPIFRATNGFVVGYVHGFRAQTIMQRHAQAVQQVALPQGMSRDYVENIHAVYSVGIKMESAKVALQGFGVSL